MGYVPKYASRKGEKPRFAVLGSIVAVLSAAVTLVLLWQMSCYVGKPVTAGQTNLPGTALMERFDAFVGEEVAAIRGRLTPSAQPEETEAAEIIRKHYWIEDGTLVAPEPNPACYGQTEDPSTLQWLLDEAAWLLDGQELYFSLDVELFRDSVVNYYLDDSIFAITWKEVHDGSVYTFSEIKVADPSQFRRHLAGGEYGSAVQYYTTEMAQSVNAVVASAGDFYRFRQFGVIVYDGVVRRVDGTYAETCYIDGNGDMHFTYGGDLTTMEDAQAFVEENDIQFSIAFGPVLVDDYEIIQHTQYGVGEINEGYARAALCQMGQLHYIVAAANTQGPYQEIPTVAMFRENIAATGCRMAYCLDGGQTATIVMNDELINRPVYGQQRKISDILYFATAVPEGEWNNG